MDITQRIKQQTIEARIVREDGTAVELGVIAYWHRNPLRRWAWQLGQLLRGRRAGRIHH